MTYVRPRSTCPVRAIGDPAKVYRLRKARGTSARTDAARATAHVKHLLALHLTPEAIARAAGISRAVVDRLAADEQRLIDRRIEARLLAVSWRPHPRQAVCLAIGARRRVHALARIGWSIVWQGEQIGIRGTNLASQIVKDRISYSTWVAIRDLYDRYSMTPGPSRISARIARQSGWLPPLAWDDHLIDDPTINGPDLAEETVDVDTVAIARFLDGDTTIRLTRAEKVEAARMLRDQGRSITQIAEALHVSGATARHLVTAVEADCQEAVA